MGSTEEKSSTMNIKNNGKVHDKLDERNEDEADEKLKVTIVHDDGFVIKGAASPEEGDENIFNSESAQEEEEDESFDGVPVDRGWAWVICAGCFEITFIMSTYDQVLSVMFVDIKERFNVSYTTAAIVFTIYSIFFSVGSVVSSNAIAPRFGDRVVVVAAAACNSFITIIIAFSQDIALFHTLHLIKGFCVGSMWIPAIGLIGQYFKRRRSLATVLANAGVGVSLLAVPPLVRRLLDEFGLQGALLLVSAMEMHGVAMGMLLRPASSYRRRAQKKCEDEAEGGFQWGSDNHVYDALPQSKEGLNDHTKNHKNGDPLLKEIVDFSNEKDCCTCVKDDINDHKKTINKTRGTQNGNRVRTSQEKMDTSIKCNGEVETSEKYTLCSVRCPDAEREESTDHHQQDYPSCLRYREYGSPRKAHKNKPYSPEKVIYIEEETPVLPHDKDYLKERSQSSCCRRGLGIVTGYFDTKLLSDWLMRLILGSTVLGALLQYIPAYIPTLAVERGVGKPSAAILLTICGGVNLASLLLQGFIVDCKVLTAASFIGIAQCIVGTMCHLTHFFTSFPTLVLLSVTYGLFGGARMSLIPVVAMDFVGVANLSKALGFNAMVATISLSIHHPLLGQLLETTGSFAVPFHYVGLALYVSAGLLLLEPLGRKLNAAAENPDRT